MAMQYPHIFKARQPITTAYTTHEGNPVYWIKVSDQPETDEADEPEILYTALHHAREPNSLSQMIFYLWYLLENYETNPEVKYLVDNVEMYFVPCLNPDGYQYNQATNPGGFGYWRKNRRYNNDGSYGVDLNRNYGYQWGYNDIGSSPNTSSEVYRGTAPFSEPETQMIKEFCENHQFQIALNYHTYGNLLIYPFGYTDSPTPDHETFTSFASWLSRDNNYKSGFGSQTVGYNVNGGSDDWMYGEMTTKGKIFSYTPEVGPGAWGFWPPQEAIDGLNKDAMTQNLSAAHLLLNYGVLTPASGNFIANSAGSVSFNLKKLGLAQGGFTVSLEPISDNIANVGDAIHIELNHLEETADEISYVLKPSIQEGDTVAFNLVLDNGLYLWRQHVQRIYTTQAEIALFDSGDDISNWSAIGAWSLTEEAFHSSPTSITDSPGTLYEPNTVSEIVSITSVKAKEEEDLHVFLSFWAKWDIEPDFDYAQVLISINGSAFIPLCGKYSEIGTQEQLYNEPVYEGIQPSWVKEDIDLTEWLSLDDSVEFKVAFRLFSDQGIEGDGFYFDDLELLLVKKDGVSSVQALDADDFKTTTRPNPGGDQVIIELAGETVGLGNLQLQVFNALGQQVAKQPVRGNIAKLETGNWLPGLYQYKLVARGQSLPGGRFLIQR
jgi:hypothetical protein